MHLQKDNQLQVLQNIFEDYKYSSYLFHIKTHSQIY